MTNNVTIRKKLIEVALPLEAINIASAREKSIRHGHPSTLHLWWARRPLAAARAVIFAQMVDDPSEYVEALLSIAETKRAAEKELKKRLELWRKRVEAFEAATGDEAVAVPEAGTKPTLEEAAADLERNRLFRIIEQLVLWENTTNESVLNQAREEIWQSWRRTCAENADHPRAKELFNRHKLPAFHDPFAGGGALPLEAQRLGLEAYATDLNPVAVLINKAMIEIPPKFADKPPINPDARREAEHGELRAWKGAHGLAEDVRYYGKCLRDAAEATIGHLYPKFEITHDTVNERPDLAPLLGKQLTVIAWIWARTVKSPNPAFANVDVPLVSTFWLSTKVGKEAYIEPVIGPLGYKFAVKVGKPCNADLTKSGTKLSRGANFQCLMSGAPITGNYIKSEGRSGRMGARLMAVVAEGTRGRIYLSPTSEHEAVALRATPLWHPDTPLAPDLRALWTPAYGLTKYGDLFTSRQLVALTQFADLIKDTREKISQDAIAAGFPNDGISLCDGGIAAKAYAEAVGIYLAFAVSKMTNIGSSIASWMSDRGAFRETFARQAIPMTWDFAEANTFADIGGSFAIAIEKGSMAIDAFPTGMDGNAFQMDAATQSISQDKVISTDPPYYDNIGYADLSDFFYVWLRRSLRTIFPNLFSTLAVPKAEELVATPYRHGSKEKAEKFFLVGMTQAMNRIAEQAHPAFPVTIYYAFKQSENDIEEGITNTGWDTFLAAVIEAGFAVTGTWPVRTEGSGRMIALGNNALASSIVLVCRKHQPLRLNSTRRDFLAALKIELPRALENLQHGNIAPVDLAQAAIGPGMAIFTRYEKVMDAEGKTLTVRDALALINQILEEVLSAQEGDFDSDTRWAVAWFDQFGFADGDFGTADVLARAKVTAVEGLVDAGIVLSRAGKVRLLKPGELPADWAPETDERLTVWEIVHHLIRVFEAEGETGASAMLARIGVRAEVARELAYRLYSICERKRRSTEALSYNALVQSWPEINRLARAHSDAISTAGPAQGDLLGRN